MIPMERTDEQGIVPPNGANFLDDRLRAMVEESTGIRPSDRDYYLVTTNGGIERYTVHAHLGNRIFKGVAEAATLDEGILWAYGEATQYISTHDSVGRKQPENAVAAPNAVTKSGTFRPSIIIIGYREPVASSNHPHGYGHGV